MFKLSLEPDVPELSYPIDYRWWHDRDSLASAYRTAGVWDEECGDSDAILLSGSESTECTATSWEESEWEWQADAVQPVFAEKQKRCICRDGRTIVLVKRSIEEALLRLTQRNMADIYEAVKWVNEDGSVGFSCAAKWRELFELGSKLVSTVHVPGWEAPILLGFVSVMSCPDFLPGLRTDFICEFQVQQFAQGDGIGTTLLQSVEERATTGGRKAVHLNVQTSNKKAMAWYKGKDYVLDKRLSPGGSDPSYHALFKELKGRRKRRR